MQLRELFGRERLLALQGTGTSEGARKGWETRRGGGVAQDERKGEDRRTSAFGKAEKIILDRLRKNPNATEAQQAISALTRLRKAQVEQRIGERRGSSGVKISVGSKGKTRWMSREQKERIDREHLQD